MPKTLTSDSANIFHFFPNEICFFKKEFSFCKAHQEMMPINLICFLSADSSSAFVLNGYRTLEGAYSKVDPKKNRGKKWTDKNVFPTLPASAVSNERPQRRRWRRRRQPRAVGRRGPLLTHSLLSAECWPPATPAYPRLPGAVERRPLFSQSNAVSPNWRKKLKKCFQFGGGGKYFRKRTEWSGPLSHQTKRKNDSLRLHFPMFLWLLKTGTPACPFVGPIPLTHPFSHAKSLIILQNCYLALKTVFKAFPVVWCPVMLRSSLNNGVLAVLYAEKPQRGRIQPCVATQCIENCPYTLHYNTRLP